MKRTLLIIAFLGIVGSFSACNRSANHTPLDSGEPLVQMQWGQTDSQQSKKKKKKKRNWYNRNRSNNNNNYGSGRNDYQSNGRDYNRSYNNDSRYRDNNQYRYSSEKVVLGDLSIALPAPRRDIPEQRLTRKGYTSSFNNQTLMPNWVAWQLTKARTYGNQKRGNVKFQEDFDVAPQYRVTTFDYNRSGFDRGHMCPAGDNRWDSQAMAQCFLMTNMCPQGHNLNSGDWNDLEIQCRDWARQYGEIYIVCGPILHNNAHRRIGQRHKVTVPDAFFKVVLCMKGTPKAIGFIYPHKDGHRSMSEYVSSVDEVERITGYDFFAALPDNVERTVEARANLRDW